MAFTYVMIGGALGAVTRFGLGKLFPISLAGIQVSTLLVNIIGCFIAGIGLHYFNNDGTKAFWMIGFCGALTTFSAYMLEIVQLLENKSFASVALLWFLHHSLCFLVFYISYKKLPLLLG